MRNTGSRVDATRLLASNVAAVTSCVIVNSPPAARASSPALRASGERDTSVVVVAVRLLDVVVIGGSSFDDLKKIACRFCCVLRSTLPDQRMRNTHPKVQS